MSKEKAERRRRALWRIFETRFGGVQKELADAIDRSPAQAWQLLNGRRNIGERLAEHIEQRLKLSPGALESGEIEIREDVAEYVVSIEPKTREELLLLFDDLSAQQQAEYLEKLRKTVRENEEFLTDFGGKRRHPEVFVGRVVEDPETTARPVQSRRAKKKGKKSN